MKIFDYVYKIAFQKDEKHYKHKWTNQFFLIFYIKGDNFLDAIELCWYTIFHKTCSYPELIILTLLINKLIKSQWSIMRVQCNFKYNKSRVCCCCKISKSNATTALYSLDGFEKMLHISEGWLISYYRSSFVI